MGNSTKLLLTLLILFNTFVVLADYNDFKTSSEFSYEKFKNLIEQNDIKSVEKALEATKLYYPEFFDNYILMYHSRSLQGSSFKAPRAILFDRSAQFVFSFNGEKGQRGFERIEIMQYRNETQKFEFREIIFNDFKNPEFSEPNPQKCLACHQNLKRTAIDPRPNWEPYNIWPGAFGSISGGLVVSNYHKNLEQLKGADPLILQNAALEKEKLDEFLNEIQPQHPRYKYLTKEKFDSHQTVDFTDLLTRLSFERITRIIKDDFSDVYNLIYYTFEGVVRCEELMVSEEAFKWLKTHWGESEFKAYQKPQAETTIPLRNVFNDTEEYERYLQYEKNKKLEEEKREPKWKYPKVNTSEGLHHLFEPIGISTADWSMDFKTGGKLAFRERFGTPSNTSIHMRNAFKKILASNNETKSCAELGKKSEKQFDEFMKSPLFFARVQSKEAEKRDPFILSRCVKCHESRDYSIPQISFSDPEKLKVELNLRSQLSSRKLIDEIKYRLGDYAKEDERMPLGPMITNKQRIDFIKFIDQLSDPSRGR